MFAWVRKQLDKIGSPNLDWVQVEITTHCNGSCIYCPNNVMRQSWANKHMPIQLFCKLVPFLRYADLVYLQGWGEPLLNNDLFEMLRICKYNGKCVGFTTNGMLLKEDMIQTLIELNLDIIGISLAGTNNRIRIRAMSFGNISNESLTRIWNKKEYTKFREHFKPRITRNPEQILLEMPQCCVKCYKRLGA